LRFDKVLHWDALEEQVVMSNESPQQLLASLPLPSFAC